ncbi:hypothetical protein ScPMuIL_014064 [Solemya velum]
MPPPYSTSIPGPLVDGRSIVLKGRSTKKAEGFAINLEYESKADKKKDIAFHFNPRFNEKCIVRNTMVNKNWGTEERGGGFPLQKEVPFVITIHVNSKHFKVLVNGRHFCDYKHRVSLNLVNVVSVSLGIGIDLLRFDGFSGSPSQSMTIPGPLVDGRSIVLKGRSPEYLERFAIDLLCESKGDIAFHFNPRFNEKCIVRNTKVNNNWGTEERGGCFPLQKEVPFEIVIQVNANHFTVLVNGQHFCTYKHRVPINLVNIVAVSDGINIDQFRFDGFAPVIPGGGGFVPPGVQPEKFNMVLPGGGGFVPPGFQPEMVNIGLAAKPPPPIYNPPVPLVTSIQGGIYQGMMISVSGHPHPSAKRMSINLCCGSGSKDIALHFDVRFDHIGDKNVIVRNHRVNNQWGSEERSISHFPFIPSSNFDILILCDAVAFKVAVNNQHFLEFAHRIMPPIGVDTLEVTGDVHLTLVRFQ